MIEDGLIVISDVDIVRLTRGPAEAPTDATVPITRHRRIHFTDGSQT